jgi:serine protease
MAPLRLLLVLLCACGSANGATAAELNPARRAPASAMAGGDAARIIVKLRASARAAEARGGDDAGVITRSHGFAVRRLRPLGGDLENVHVALGRGETLAGVLAKLRADRRVAFAEEDRRRYPQALPNDPLLDGQWYLKAVETAALDALAAWDITTGSDGIVIADIDTGLRLDHPDLKRVANGGRLLPGYDFISADGDGSFRTANDGDGRDADPSDPGDWITAADKNAPLFQDCEEQPSSWHGTRVAGILGALSNNGAGIAGTTWKGWILPVRTLGKCGGYDSDIIAGMQWAAGLTVAGVPANPFPARVLNLSLGSAGACPQSYQSVVDDLTARGVVIVASAGNEGSVVGTPASCQGVVAVAGLRASGEKVGFSSLGPEVAISAPGGNCVNTAPGSPCLFSIDTTINDGQTAPGADTYGDPFAISVGTSFAAPMVSGLAALMLSVNGKLSPAQITARLREGSRPFPAPDPGIPVCRVPVDANDLQDTTCACTTSTCGAGMAHAPGALAAARRPIAAVEIVTASVVAGSDVALRATGSAAACNQSIASYAWTVVGGGASPPAITGADTANASVAAPAAGTLTLRLTVTDNAGRSDTALVQITPNSATTSAPNTAGAAAACPQAIDPTPPEPPPQPPPPSGGSGGGGTTGLAVLLPLVALARYRRRARPGRA